MQYMIWAHQSLKAAYISSPTDVEQKLLCHTHTHTPNSKVLLQTQKWWLIRTEVISECSFQSHYKK